MADEWVMEPPAAPQPAAADDGWVMEAPKPAAPAPVAAAPKADKGVLRQIFDGISAAGNEKLDAAAKQPGPHVPDIANAWAAAKQPFIDAAHSIGQDIRNPAEAPALSPRGFIQGLKDSAARTGHLGAAVMAPMAAANDVITTPVSEALGLPKSAVDQAVMALGPGKGRAPKFSFSEAAAEPVKPTFAGKPQEAPVPAAATTPAAPAEMGPETVRTPAVERVGKKAGLKAAEAPLLDPKGGAQSATGIPVTEQNQAAKVVSAPEPTGSSPAMPAEVGPILDPVVKGEPVEALGTRADDALHRLEGNATADKLEVTAKLKDIPAEVKSPGVQEAVYHDIERRMISPKAPITPGTEAAHAALEPWRGEEASLFKDIKAAGYGDMVQGPQIGDAYVHRVVQGKGHWMDDSHITGGAPSNPTASYGGRTLSRDASALHSRKFLVIEGPDGVRNFVADPKGMTVNQPFLGPDMQFHTPKFATTAEIEANTGVRYHKNALANTIDNVLKLRAVKRNIELLEQLKGQMAERDLIHYRQSDGPPPRGYVKLTMPQFAKDGAYADPRIGHVLNDFHGELMRGGDFNQLVSKLNRFLTGSIFITPIPHAWNVANHWATGRGWDWIKPAGYKSLMVDGTRAIKEVLTNGPLYQRLLREGSGLIAGGVDMDNFHQLLIRKLGAEISQDQKAWAPIAKMFGFSSPARLVKAVYRLSSQTLWKVNDMFMMQRTLEQARKGMPIRKAILEAEKDIPNYRIPSHINGSRALSEVMRNPNLMMFGRYRYGQFKAYAEMGKEMFRPGASKAERADGAGKLFIMAAMAMGGYPILDKLLRHVSGNDHAEVHRGGGLTPIKAVVDAATGEKSVPAAMASIYGIPPVLSTVPEIVNNKDNLGRNIVEPGSTPLGMGVQAAEYAGAQVSPIGTALQAMRGQDTEGGTAAALAPLAAIKLPTDKSIANKAKSKHYDKRRAVKREARDPLQQIVEDLIR